MISSKERFAEHLRKSGFALSEPREQILRRLAEKMGPKRFGEVFQNRSTVPTPQTQEAFYAQFRDIVEANLMRSLDGDATLEASFHLYRRAVDHLKPGTRVIELGCWTGGLASFIALNHPEVQVTAVDMARNVVDACSDFYRLPNLSFTVWDYNFGKPEGLAESDVLLCSMGVVHRAPENETLFDPNQVSRSAEYLRQRDQALRYFGAWRAAARPSATLYAVLRIAPYPRFFAWNKAAEHAGWTPELQKVSFVPMEGGKSRLPSLAFTARKGAPVKADSVLAALATVESSEKLFGRFKGSAAISVYRSLSNKTTLGRREYRKGGLLVADEVGVTGLLGYVLTYDALANFRLLLITADQADSLASGIRTKGSSTPVNDSGEFASSVPDAGALLLRPTTGPVNSFSQRSIA